jgi:hypothetical protein
MAELTVCGIVLIERKDSTHEAHILLTLPYQVCMALKATDLEFAS